MRLPFKHRWAHRVQAVLRRRSPRGTSAPFPTASPPPTAEWDEAFLRVESYLRAHRIESRVLLNRLTAEIIEAARTLAAEHPQEPPVTLAMQIAHAKIGEWLVHVLGTGDWADERFRARGRLALLLAEIPERHPEQFLAHRTLPAETKARLGAAALEAGPELRLTRMPRTELEFPLAEIVEEKWVTFSRSTFTRAATSWILIVSFLGMAWFATR
jgi:hypothetical protein